MARNREKWQKGIPLDRLQREALQGLVLDYPSPPRVLVEDMDNKISAKWLGNLSSPTFSGRFNVNKLRALLSYFGYSVLDLKEGKVGRSRRKFPSSPSYTNDTGFGELVNQLIHDTARLHIPLSLVESVSPAEIVRCGSGDLDLAADKLRRDAGMADRLGFFPQAFCHYLLAAKIYFFGERLDKTQGVFCVSDSLNSARLNGNSSRKIRAIRLLDESLDRIEKLPKDAASRVLSDLGMLCYTHRYLDSGLFLFKQAKQILGPSAKGTACIVLWTIERRIASLIGESNWEVGSKQLDRVLAEFEGHRRGVSNSHLAKLMTHALHRKRKEWGDYIANHEFDITVESMWNKGIFLCLRGLYSIATGRTAEAEPDLCTSLATLVSIGGSPALGPGGKKWREVCPDELLGGDHPDVRAHGSIQVPVEFPLLNSNLRDLTAKVKRRCAT